MTSDIALITLLVVNVVSLATAFLTHNREKPTAVAHASSEDATAAETIGRAWKTFVDEKQAAHDADLKELAKDLEMLTSENAALKARVLALETELKKYANGGAAAV